MRALREAPRLMARVALLTIGDGRDDLLAQTMASLAENVGTDWAHHVHVDDRSHRLGFSGAIEEGWERLRHLDGFDYVWHLEEDFTFNRPIPLDALALLLDVQPQLAQIALLRQPWAPAEIEAGGLVALWPDLYADRSLTVWDVDQRITHLAWLEHDVCFTTNPSLYRRDLIARHWPGPPGSEARMTLILRAEGWRFALWGDRDDGPAVHHTGTNRLGGGY